MRRVVLVGAGHAHLHALRHTAEFVRRGFEVTVVAPECFWYSGLATGVLGGRYAAEEDQVDVEALVVRAGGRFLRERVEAIDAVTQTLRLTHGELTWDVLSLNLGSETRPLPGDQAGVFPIKPLHELWRLRQALEADLLAGQKPRVVVAGGGASGLEIAANVHSLLRGQVSITVVARGSRLAPSLSSSAAAALAKWLRARGIVILARSGVRELAAGVAQTACGRALPFDYLINATGLHAPALFAGSGLPVSADGELLVDEHLRAHGSANVFGGGDCVRFGSEGLAKIGVYAVRESPVLTANLLATLEGRPLQVFRPQRSYLLILYLGDGCGLASWRGLHWLGRAAFWLKDWIDRRFLARSRLPA